MYCAACDEESLSQASPNTKTIDFRCSNCLEAYQLKSQKQLNLQRIVDGAYGTLLSALKQNRAPNLLLLNYSNDWTIKSLFLIPSVFFTESVLQRRRPLSATARRAGWIGCNLLLSNVPDEAKIPLVQNAQVVPSTLVRKIFQRYQKLESIQWNLRGWTLDVLRIAQPLGTDFTLTQMYEREPDLLRLHPANRNIKAKIRQQLQVLRDLSFIEFLGQGRYRMKSNPK